MKLFDIAFKDMLRYFRSAFAVGMMFIVPLMIAGLLAFAFGGVLKSSETSAYTLPVIKLQIANLDEGDASSGVNMGSVLVSALTSEEVKNVFAVTETKDETAARAAVDGQQAALALIVPANLTRSALTGQEQSAVTLYQDPTLSFGPGITREIVSQFLDALSGGQIAIRVAREQLTAQGQVLTPEAAQQIQAAYGQWFTQIAGQQGWNLPASIRLPNSETPKSVGDHRTTLLGPIMAGMMIFFVFFTGTNTAQSLIKEQEEGTLARMFTTPVSMATILGGKLASVFLTLIVQSIVLMIASSLIFNIDWGNLATLTLVTIGLVVSGSGFGVFLMSFMKNSRQAGAISGAVLAIMGMLGGLYTTGLPSVPEALNTIGVITPVNWALRGLNLSLAGAAPQDVLLPLLVMLAFGIVFFTAGVYFFGKRFA
jgi:ABC-2 type transport system permease protein